MFSVLERTKRLEEHLRQKAEAELQAAAMKEDENAAEDAAEDAATNDVTVERRQEAVEAQDYTRGFGRR